MPWPFDPPNHKATVHAYFDVFRARWMWIAEAELRPGDPFSRYRMIAYTWKRAIEWALNPTATVRTT